MVTINELIAEYGFDKLNSLTKYPSILTYHTMGEKGILQESLSEDASFHVPVYVTEKIDGTNTRIVMDSTGDYLIGSRANFLTAKGDRIANPAMGIVGAITAAAERLTECSCLETDGLKVIYGETYGGSITPASKQYTNDKSIDFRLFDIVVIPEKTCRRMLSNTPDHIVSWRERGGQGFQNYDVLTNVSDKAEIEMVPLLTTEQWMPTDRADVYKWLQRYKTTSAGINNEGRAEGVVLRDYNRSLIRKIRFEDYERTLKKLGYQLL